jgi:outer membrane protein assembly factor BamB
VIVPSSGTSHNLPDARDGVSALDLDLGKIVWSTHFQGDANGVAATEGLVIATSDDGHTYALDIKDGKVRWKQKGQGKVYSNPLILPDQVVVGDAGGSLRSYALSDGAPRWSHSLKRAIRGGAAADEERIYAVSEGAEAIAVGMDGKLRWRVAVNQGGRAGGPVKGYAAPVLTDRTVIIPFARDTSYDTPALIGLDKKTGKTDWVASSARPGVNWGNIRGTPVLIQGSLIYGEPYSGDVAAIDAGTGQIRYRKTLGPCFFPQYASATAAGDVVYLPRFDGTLSAFRAGSGAVLWQMYLGEEKLAGGLPPAAIAGQRGCAWDLPAGAPLSGPAAIAPDGRIYIGSAEGFLYAIGDAQVR